MKKTKESISLNKKYNDIYSGVRQSYIRTTDTISIKIFKKLSMDLCSEVRRDVAKHAKVPASILHTLASDDDRYIQEAIASHPNTFIKTLEQLSKSKYILVKHAVVANPKTSNALYKKFLKTKDYDFHIALLKQDRTPNSYLESDEYKYLHNKKAIIKNPKLASLDINFNTEIRADCYVEDFPYFPPITFFSSIHKDDYPVFLQNFKAHVEITKDINTSDFVRHRALVWVKKHIDFIAIATNQITVYTYYYNKAKNNTI